MPSVGMKRCSDESSDERARAHASRVEKARKLLALAKKRLTIEPIEPIEPRVTSAVLEAAGQAWLQFHEEPEVVVVGGVSFVGTSFEFDTVFDAEGRVVHLKVKSYDAPRVQAVSVPVSAPPSCGTVKQRVQCGPKGATMVVEGPANMMA